MAEETYPLVQREGRWWLPYRDADGCPMEVDAELLAGLWMADTQVVFLGPEGGSFAYRVDDEGREQIRLDFGAWTPVGAVTFAPCPVSRNLPYPMAPVGARWGIPWGTAPLAPPSPSAGTQP